MHKVLIVDDSPIDRVLLEGVLRRERDLQVTSATNGVEALTRMEAARPDVVITDLQMPEMDGLQLVTELRLRYPQVPVILITAMGSESLAMQALEQGASSYVPKSQLNERLVEALRHVISLAHADRSYERLTQCMDMAELRFNLDNDLAVFDRLVELVQQIAVSMAVCDAGAQIRLGLALEESLKYMMLRGNFEFTDAQMQEVLAHAPEGLTLLEERRTTAPYSQRRLKVECRLSPAEVAFTIEHGGPGFAAPGLPGSDAAVELEAAASRSLVIMSTMLDEASFSPDGKVLKLVKRGANNR